MARIKLEERGKDLIGQCWEARKKRPLRPPSSGKPTKTCTSETPRAPGRCFVCRTNLNSRMDECTLEVNRIDRNASLKCHDIRSESAIREGDIEKLVHGMMVRFFAHSLIRKTTVPGRKSCAYRKFHFCSFQQYQAYSHQSSSPL